MALVFERLIGAWDGEEVLVRFDEPSGAWMFVGVHSTALGPAMGGTRMKTYSAPADGLRDVLRLSGAMTLKNAAAGIPFGGGKAVLAVPEIPDGGGRRRLLLRYAEMVDSLGGTYVTAADMNTDERDMDVIGERCPFVLGRSEAAGGAGDSGPATAVGVYHGIRVSVAHAFGGTLAGRSILVQGVGAVGEPLARLLARDGARVLVSDLDGRRATAVAAATGAETVDPGAVIGTRCDVYAPCATGAALSEDTVPKLDCRIVAGAANNQLATDADAERLHAAGILYTPDFVVNAGGVLHLACLEALGLGPAELEARLAGIEATLAEVFEAADAEGITPDAAARRLAATRIASAAGP